MIQLQRLEGFYWVARCEGYARAARSFPYPITQPGVHPFETVEWETRDARIGHGDRVAFDY